MSTKRKSNSNRSSTSLELTGKPATSAYFEMSGIRSKGKQMQRPFITFRRRNNKINVELVNDVQKLVQMPLKTRVMAQWEGKERSDFYRFTVGDLKEYLEDNPAKRHQAV